MSNYNLTLQSNNTDLQTILNSINELPNAGGEPVLQDKTVTPSTNKQTITADSGYDGLDTVTVNAMPTTTQATPTVTVDSSTGLITATATQTAGYVTAGTKSGTKQLAFQPAQTITPTTTNQTIPANTYLGGTQTIKGDANLVASNIVSGKSIFGVVGTAATGSGGDTSVEDGLVTGSLTSYTNKRITSIRDFAFYSCKSLKSVNFPNVTQIGESAFCLCSNLTTISFPNVTDLGRYAFAKCSKLTSAIFPKLSSIRYETFRMCNNLTLADFPNVKIVNSYAFASCYNLAVVSFPKATEIWNQAFMSCSKLSTITLPKANMISASAFQMCSLFNEIYLMDSKVCTLKNSNAFNNTKITSTTGSIFVPASLVASYKAATNWTYFSNRIFAYYPGGGAE
jgi:hypothetical protein